MAIPTWQLAGLGGWLISILASGSIANAKALSETITVDLMHGPITEFLPDEVFGGALDGHEAGEVKQIYSTENMQRMLGAGLRKVTYRLRTELGIEAWHWGEEGSWSDPNIAKVMDLQRST
jgi:hypothetical protein